MESFGVKSQVSDPMERRRKKSAMKRKAMKFSKIVSLVGMRHATDSRNTFIRRVIWVIWLVFGFGFALYQIEERFDYYASYPAETELTVITGTDDSESTHLQLPQITICSENQIFASKAKDKGVYRNITTIEAALERERFYKRKGEVDEEVFTNITTLLIEAMEELHSKTRDWWNISKALSQPATSAILSVSYDGLNQTISSFAKEVVTDLGHCFAFGTKESPLLTKKHGALNGLNIMLYAPRNEIIPCARYLRSADALPGYRVLLHDPEELPRLKNAGFSLKPGTRSRVAVTFENVTFLDQPYGNCYSKAGYKEANCFAKCDDKAFQERCHCKDIYMEGVVEYCSYGNILNCSEFFQVRRYNVTVPPTKSDDCHCPRQCHVRVYTHSFSSSKLPDLIAKDYKDKSLDDLIEAYIYYPQMSYQQKTSIPAYNVFRLLCDVGGALSLFLGATLLTVYEALEFLLVLFKDYVHLRLAN